MNKTFYGVASITNANRSKIQLQSYSPGPGCYDTQSSIGSGPKCMLKKRFKHGGCFQQKQNNPAPGTYELKMVEKSFSKKLNKSHIGDKYKNYVDKCPMSELNIPSGFNSKSGFVFGYRDQVVIKQFSPGPIYYINQIIQQKRQQKKKNTCIGFGLGSKDTIYKQIQNNPSPTAYQPANLFNTSTSWTFAKQHRSLQKNSQSTLGPGQYSPKIITVTKSCKFKQKLPSFQPQRFSNGPGSYNLPNNSTNIGTKFNQQKIRSLQLCKNDSPSPFSYQKKRFPQNISSSAGFTLASSLKMPNSLAKAQNPSPGTYDISTNVGKGCQGGYIGRKSQAKSKQNKGDNFYKYTPKIDTISKVSHKYSFGHQQNNRGGSLTNSDLGPGSYTIKQNGGSNYSFGKGSRWPQLTKQPYLNSFPNSNLSSIGYIPQYLLKKEAKK